MDKFSIIIPTIWKSQNLHNILKGCYECPWIHEVILIDNDSKNKFEIETNDKLILVQPNKNLYVNPSWNLGVRMAKYDKVMIVNDDIQFPWGDLFNFYMDMTTRGGLKFEDLGFIGMHSENYSGGGNYMTIENYENITNKFGWGCLFFFHKKWYRLIPEQLKIWYGDNFLHATGAPIMQIRGLPMKFSEMSVSSELDEVREIRDNDTIEWNKIINTKQI